MLEAHAGCRRERRHAGVRAGLRAEVRQRRDRLVGRDLSAHGNGGQDGGALRLVDGEDTRVGELRAARIGSGRGHGEEQRALELVGRGHVAIGSAGLGLGRERVGEVVGAEAALEGHAVPHGHDRDGKGDKHDDEHDDTYDVCVRRLARNVTALKALALPEHAASPLLLFSARLGGRALEHHTRSAYQKANGHAHGIDDAGDRGVLPQVGICAPQDEQADAAGYQKARDHGTGRQGAIEEELGQRHAGAAVGNKPHQGGDEGGANGVVRQQLADGVLASTQ